MRVGKDKSSDVLRRVNRRRRWKLAAGVILAGLLLTPGIIWAVRYFSPFRIEHIQLVPQADNRLRMTLEIDASKSCDAVVAYWVPNSRDTFYSVVSKGLRHHAITLTNLEGPRNYQFRVLAYPGGGDSVRRSLVHAFVTEPIYQATPYFSLDTLDASVKPSMEHTYFLTQILSEPGSAVILNYQGEIVWYAPFKKGIKVSHWTRDRTVLCIAGAAKIPFSGGDEIIEMDLNGRVLTDWHTGVGEMDKLVHHEVRKDTAGNIYALTFDKRIVDLSRVGGLLKDTVNGDGIVLFDKAGRKLWEWSVFDHLDPLQDTAIGRRKKDWLHANALYRERGGDFLISFRNSSQIWKVQYGTGKVLWKFGEGGDFALAAEDRFSGQHSVHVNAFGDLMILDNGVKRKLSRAMSFRFDSAGKRAFHHIDVDLPKEYFSASKGSVQLMGDDKLLFSLTDPRAFLVTDMQGKILWRIEVGGDPYRLEAIPDFLNPKPVMNAGDR